jgi:hypothetical protein
MTSSDFLEFLLELAIPICRTCPPSAIGPAASWLPAYQLAAHADQWNGDDADEFCRTNALNNLNLKVFKLGKKDKVSNNRACLYIIAKQSTLASTTTADYLGELGRSILVDICSGIIQSNSCRCRGFYFKNKLRFVLR